MILSEPVIFKETNDRQRAVIKFAGKWKR
jgi:hypothetical protein